MLFRARLYRWWHCLTRFHRGVTLYCRDRPIYVGCECGYTSFGNRLTAEHVLAFLEQGE